MLLKQNEKATERRSIGQRGQEERSEGAKLFFKYLTLTFF